MASSSSPVFGTGLRASPIIYDLTKLTNKHLDHSSTGPEWNVPPADFEKICSLFQEKKETIRHSEFSVKINGSKYQIGCFSEESSETESKKVGFIFLKDLKTSTYGSLKIAKTLEGKTVVLKIISHARLGENELEIYEKFDKMTRSMEHFVFGPRLKSRVKTALVLPYLKNGDLLNYYNHVLLGDRERLNREVYSISRQIFDAIAYLHRHRIVHMDIKLENFMMGDDGRILLTDFGFSTFKGEILNAPKGSPGYLDPYFFKMPLPETLVCSPASDVWSAGICLSILARGPHFQNWTRQKEQQDYSYLSDMSPSSLSGWKAHYFPDRKDPLSLQSVINRCLRLKQEKRISSRRGARLIQKLIDQRSS